MDYTILLSVVAMVFSLMLFCVVILEPLKTNSASLSFNIFAILCLLAPMLEITFFITPSEMLIPKIAIYKFFLIEELLWIVMFTVLLISVAATLKNNTGEKHERKRKGYSIFFMILYILSSVGILIAPVTANDVSSLSGTFTGPAVILFYVLAIFYGTLSLISAIKGLIELRKPIFVPFLLFAIISFISLAIHSSYHSIALLAISQIVAEYIIYFELKAELM